MTEQEFLLDTVKYYSEDTNRLCVSGGSCKYSPLTANKEGISEGCAIGRHLSEEVKLKYDKIGNGQSVSSLFRDYPDLRVLAPQWMQNMSLNYLIQIQRLHDTGDHWNIAEGKGLTPFGQDYVVKIINSYNFEMEPFKPYLKSSIDGKDN